MDLEGLSDAEARELLLRAVHRTRITEAASDALQSLSVLASLEPTRLTLILKQEEGRSGLHLSEKEITLVLRAVDVL